ncbi:MAG: sensor histidine kinase, partial [Betaproteobacteria bacterium]
SYMAHEVRQPLTTILSNSQMAKHMLQQTPPQFRDLDRIMGAIVQAVTRIDSLMQRLSRYGRSSIRNVSHFSFADVVLDTVELMEGHARQQRVKLHVEAPSPHIMVEGDQMELSQVLLNLIRNAIDACASLSQEGRVELKVHLQDDRVVLTVQDNGPGFDSAALVKAGQAFFTTKPDGVGLGLSISRDLSSMNHAELNWRNAAHGACVELSWPLVRINHA